MKMRHFLIAKTDNMLAWRRIKQIKNEAAKAATLFDCIPKPGPRRRQATQSRPSINAESSLFE
jgi:hypothetical protein